MCLIVDANCFSQVFDTQDKKHHSFIPVYNWLFTGHGGGLIYGGEKYKKEVDLRRSKYRPLIVELEKMGRLFEVCNKCVNEIAAELKAAVPDKNFDDEHILALVIVSRCRVVCTEDKVAISFLKDTSLYPKGVNPPVFYVSARNARLCRNAENIADVCRTNSDMCRRVHETEC